MFPPPHPPPRSPYNLLTLFPHLQNSRILFPSLLTLPSPTFKPRTPSQIHNHQQISTGRNLLPQQLQTPNFFFRIHHPNNRHPLFLHPHRPHSQSSTPLPLSMSIHAHLAPNIPLPPLSFPTATSFLLATNNFPSAPKLSPKPSRQSRPCPPWRSFTPTI